MHAPEALPGTAQGIPAAEEEEYLDEGQEAEDYEEGQGKIMFRNNRPPGPFLQQ